MPIEPTTFAPSKKPYAIAWDTLTVERRVDTRSDGSAFQSIHPSVDAVWVGRKNGLTYVTTGTLSVGGFGLATREELEAEFDCRYGGQAAARWNGHDLWAPGFTPAESAAEVEFLAAMLDGLPDPPAGYDGWYRLA